MTVSSAIDSLLSGGDAYACLRLRGLPFSAAVSEILDFFAGYAVIDVVISKSDGKPNGQAYVLLPAADALKASAELNNKFMGKRYIEVFSSSVSDMEAARRMSQERSKSVPEQALNGPLLLPAQPDSAATNLPLLVQSCHTERQINRPQQVQQLHQLISQPCIQQQQFVQPQRSSVASHIVRLRGLPFAATEADIAAFLAPVDLLDGINSIQLARHADMRPSGEAYVRLRSEAEVLAALKKHKSIMGKRYIEVFPSCAAEMRQVLGQHYQEEQQLLQGSAAGGFGYSSSTSGLSVGNGCLRQVAPLNKTSTMYGNLARPQLPQYQLPIASNGLLPISQQQQIFLAALQQHQQQQHAQQPALLAPVASPTVGAPIGFRSVSPAPVLAQQAQAGAHLLEYLPQYGAPNVSGILLLQQQQQQLSAVSAGLSSGSLFPPANMMSMAPTSMINNLDMCGLPCVSTNAALFAGSTAPSTASTADHYMSCFSSGSNVLAGTS